MCVQTLALLQLWVSVWLSSAAFNRSEAMPLERSVAVTGRTALLPPVSSRLGSEVIETLSGAVRSTTARRRFPVAVNWDSFLRCPSP